MAERSRMTKEMSLQKAAGAYFSNLSAQGEGTRGENLQLDHCGGLFDEAASSQSVKFLDMRKLVRLATWMNRMFCKPQPATGQSLAERLTLYTPSGYSDQGLRLERHNDDAKLHGS